MINAVSEREQKAEINWEMIFDNLNEPMMILDRDYRIINCNQAMVKLAEYREENSGVERVVQ
jgi:PAS domain-containing protein